MSSCIGMDMAHHFKAGFSSYYIRDPWGNKINCCCFICVTQSMGLTQCHKAALFTFVLQFGVSTFTYVVFLPQSMAEIQMRLVLKTNGPPRWDSASDFDFGQVIVGSAWFCVGLLDFIRIGPPTLELWRHKAFWRYLFFQDGGHSDTVANLRFCDVSHSSRWNAICTPNFDKISQSTRTAEIVLLSSFNF